MTARKSVIALVVGFWPEPAHAQEVTVAAAADLKFAMTEVATQYEKQTGTKVNVTYGSSGNFFTQLQNGAPFDLFFSATSITCANSKRQGLPSRELSSSTPSAAL